MTRYKFIDAVLAPLSAVFDKSCFLEVTRRIEMCPAVVVVVVDFETSAVILSVELPLCSVVLGVWVSFRPLAVPGVGVSFRLLVGLVVGFSFFSVVLDVWVPGLGVGVAHVSLSGLGVGRGNVGELGLGVGRNTVSIFSGDEFVSPILANESGAGKAKCIVL